MTSPGSALRLFERPFEDPRMRLLEADARAGGDEVEVPHEVEGMEELRQVPDPVAHGADRQAALLQRGEGRIRIGKDVPVAGHHEQLAKPTEEGVGHRLKPELRDRGRIDLDGAPEARLLVRLESGVVDAPAAVVVGASQRGVQLADLDLDAEFAEGDLVDSLPRGIRAHHGVADVQEDGAQRPGLIGHG